jgi:hypothetical protein
MAWNLLLTSDIGLLSLFTIFFMLGMGVFLYGYVRRHMADDEKVALGAKAPKPH